MKSDNQLASLLEDAISICSTPLPVPNLKKLCSMIMFLLKSQQLPASVLYSCRTSLTAALKNAICEKFGGSLGQQDAFQVTNSPSSWTQKYSGLNRLFIIFYHAIPLSSICSWTFCPIFSKTSTPNPHKENRCPHWRYVAWPPRKCSSWRPTDRSTARRPTR